VSIWAAHLRITGLEKEKPEAGHWGKKVAGGLKSGPQSGQLSPHVKWGGGRDGGGKGGTVISTGKRLAT